VTVAFLVDFADLHFVTKRFKNKWMRLHPEGRDPRTLRVELGNLSAGVTAWSEFTHGREEYFGGLMTSGLKKKGNFAIGYGVYFTSQRVIGIKTKRWFVVILILAALAAVGGASAIGLLIGASPAYASFIGLAVILVVIAWGQKRLRFEDPLSIEELERRKDFEIRREDLSEIDLRGPGLVRRGHLTITPKAGKDITLMITQEAGVFERLRGLVSGFCFVPPASWIKGRPLTINYPTPSYTYQGKDDTANTGSVGTQGVLDERHVEQRDFEWCPHCATPFIRGTRVCPNCGKVIGS